MIASNRQFSDCTITGLKMDDLSEDDVTKFSAILEKFGNGVHHLIIHFDLIAEEDVRAVISYFPTIKSLIIRRHCRMGGIVPKAKMVQKTGPLVFPSLASIVFDSDELHFDKIFDDIRTDNIKKVYVRTWLLSRCFDWLKKNRSISELSLSTPHFFSSIPIDHLTLKSITIEMPNAKSLISLFEQQMEMEYFELRNFFVSKRRQLNSDESSVYSESSDSDSNNPELDVNLVIAATKMRSLTQLTIRIDEIPDKDFIHFSKLTQLDHLDINSAKLDKIRIFSFISLPNLTKLRLRFNRMHVPNSDLERMAKNFPKVRDLVCQLDYFCDAFVCFTRYLDELEKLSMLRHHDYVDDHDHFVAPVGTAINVNSSLKMLSLHQGYPEEQNVHKFMIRAILTAPNLESLALENDQLKIVPGSLIHILRNLKRLKNINLSYDLRPDADMQEWLEASNIEEKEYEERVEMNIINILKTYGTQLEYVQLCLSTSDDIRGELWKEAFAHQFASIKTDHMTITMKNDVNANEGDLFA